MHVRCRTDRIHLKHVRPWGRIALSGAEGVENEAQ